MLFDTHAHLNLPPFEKDLEEVIKRCQQNNIWVINVGVNYEISKKGVEIAEKYNKGVYAAIGLHPIALDTGLIKIKTKDKLEKKFNFEKYKKLGKSSNVIAIGEIGLDYWYKPKTEKKLTEFKQKQKELLLQEIKLAEELDLPIIFHCRMAHDDLIEILRQYNLRAVVHCFTGDWQQAQKYLEMGFYLGFNGIIFKLNLDEIIKKTPLDRILIETDCPFLTPPSPRRSPAKSGTEAGRNEPVFVKYIAEKIAEVKNVSFEKIADTTFQNAKKLFEIRK